MYLGKKRTFDLIIYEIDDKISKSGKDNSKFAGNKVETK